MKMLLHGRSLSLCFLLLSLSHTSSAVSFTNWSPPGPNDVRSPCPGLNSLANNGILPHSGKGMTISILIQGLKEGLNVGIDFSTVIGDAGLLSVPNNPLAISFDLNDIDYYLDNGNNYSFNDTIFNEVLAFYEGMSETSIPVAAKAKYARVKEGAGRDPHFTYTAQQFVLSYGETALYLSTMGDPITGVAPLEYVKILFEEEHLPYLEGWRLTSVETNLASLAVMVSQLQQASGEALPEGLLLRTNTLKQAFGGYDPVTGLLAHVI